MALCAIEARQAATLDEAARLGGLWRRYLYEAERLIAELGDFGLAVSVVAENEEVSA